MTTLDDRPDRRLDHLDRRVHVAPAEPAAPGPDPSLLGLPTFVVGSLALGLAQVGYLPVAAGAGILPVLMAATGLGLLLSTVWAANAGQSTVAGIFGVFAGFWLSYAALVLGLTHGWYAVPDENATRVVGLFLICWTALIGLLTLATLRLPLAFTVLLGLVTVALGIVTAGTLLPEAWVVKVGGAVVLAFAALGAYLFASASDVALGGEGLPLGKPVRH